MSGELGLFLFLIISIIGYCYECYMPYTIYLVLSLSLYIYIYAPILLL